MRIRPTELGCKGLLLLLVLWLAFQATAYSNLFFLLLAFAVATAAVGALAAWQNLRPIAAGPLVVPAAAAGSQQRIRCSLAAPAGHAALALEWELELAGRRHRVGSVAVLHGNQHCELLLPELRRGIHHGRLWLVSRHPFGLFRAARLLAAPIELVRYPQPLPPAEELRQATSSRSDGIAGLRPFRHGDALHDLNWKATARRGAPVVIEREPAREHGGDYLLDRRAAAASFERLLQQLTGELLSQLAAGRSLRLRSQDHDSGRVLGEPGRTALLRYLAAVQRLPPDAAAPPATRAARLLQASQQEAASD